MRSASQDARLVCAFNPDECLHLDLVRSALERGNVAIDFPNYGHLQLNSALLPLSFASRFLDVSDKHIILTLRTVSAVFSVGVLVFTFLIARSFFDQLTAYAAVILLAIFPRTFFHLSVTSHPDIPQLFFLLVALYLTCRHLTPQHGGSSIAWPGAAAGLAFAAKFGGLFMLPIVWIAWSWRRVADAAESRGHSQPKTDMKLVRLGLMLVSLIALVVALLVSPTLLGSVLTHDGRIDDGSLVRNLQLARLGLAALGFLGLSLVFVYRPTAPGARSPLPLLTLGDILLSSLTFVAAFVATSPYSLRRLAFLRGIYFESQGKSVEHLGGHTAGGLRWLQVLYTPLVLGPLISIAAIAALALFLYRRRRRRPGQMLDPEAILWLWVLGYTAFLSLRIGHYVPRYLLPVIPVLVVLAAKMIGEAVTWKPGYLRPSIASLGSAFVLALFLFASISAANSLWIYRRAEMTREENSVAVAAGTWLADEYPPETRILADRYSYVPVGFNDTHTTWGGTLELLESLRPGVVVVARKISDRYREQTQEVARWGSVAEIQARHEYYRSLRAGPTEYELTRDFGEIQIFRLRQGPE